MAADGEGLYGRTDDKVITFFCFGVIIFFTVFVIGDVGPSAPPRDPQGTRARGHRAPAQAVAARGVPETSYERIGAAAVLTITRPERRNAVDVATAEGLREGFDRFEADDDARVLILSGEGPEAFCAGADLKALAEAVAAGIDPLEWLPRFADGPLGFTRLQASKPTIAAISGWCLAGGLELALWCDLRIGTEDAKLGFTERRFGVPLIDGGTQRLPRIVGMGRALEMILTGRILEAEEAHSWGLLNEVVPPGAHLEPRAGDGRGPRGASRRRRCSPTATRRSRESG